MKKQGEGKKKQEDKGKLKSKSFFREWILETFIPAGVFALFIITFVAQIYKIPSGSMRPTLKEGDRVLVAKFTYGLRVPFKGKWLLQRRAPKRGDVIVFIFDKDAGERRRNFIKRVIGTPGDGLEIKDGDVYINGQLIDEPPAIPKERFYYNRKAIGQGLSYSEGELTVPGNQFFVLGDNSGNSRDSRFWGFVPLEKVKGKALLIIWPPGRMGIIP